MEYRLCNVSANRRRVNFAHRAPNAHVLSSFVRRKSMSGKTLKTAFILILLITPALSGCQDMIYWMPSLSWFHRRDKAFAYAAPPSLPQPTVAASVGSVPQSAANTANASHVNTTGSSTPDPYAEGADQTIAESARASSGSGAADPGCGSRGRSTCSSGCCSR